MEVVEAVGENTTTNNSNSSTGPMLEDPSFIGGQEIVPSQDADSSLSLLTTPSATENPKSRLKVTIRTWNGVAVWKWLANDDTCGICRVAFDGCCPDCKYAGDDCPLVWGQCSHCFHIHCIMKWLGTQQTQHLCPMCRQEWKFKE